MERRLPFILIAAGIAIFLASFLLFAAPKACAAEVANNSLDKIVTLYRDKASSWETALRNYALTFFFLLAAIEFGVSAIRLAIRGSDASEWLAELVNQVLFLGFFLALLNNSSAWARAIVDSFRTAANQAAISSGGSSNLAPSDIFDTGLSIASKVADQTSLFSPASSLGLIVCALVILISFALIAAFLVVSLVESYVVISAGVLLMGFGGSRFTKDYAVRTMTYAVSVGAKLFVLQLLIALGQQIFQSALAKLRGQDHGHLRRGGLRDRDAGARENRARNDPGLDQWRERRQLAASRKRRRHRGRGCRCWRRGLWRRHGGAKRRPACKRTACGREAQWHGSADRLRTRLQFTAATAGNIARAAVENIGDRLSGRAHFGTRLGQMSEELERKAAVREEERGVRQTSQSQSSP